MFFDGEGTNVALWVCAEALSGRKRVLVEREIPCTKIGAGGGVELNDLTRRKVVYIQDGVVEVGVHVADRTLANVGHDVVVDGGRICQVNAMEITTDRVAQSAEVGEEGRCANRVTGGWIGWDLIDRVRTERAVVASGLQIGAEKDVSGGAVPCLTPGGADLGVVCDIYRWSRCASGVLVREGRVRACWNVAIHAPVVSGRGQRGARGGLVGAGFVAARREEWIVLAVVGGVHHTELEVTGANFTELHRALAEWSTLEPGFGPGELDPNWGAGGDRQVQVVEAVGIGDRRADGGVVVVVGGDDDARLARVVGSEIGRTANRCAVRAEVSLTVAVVVAVYRADAVTGGCSCRCCLGKNDEWQQEQWDY